MLPVHPGEILREEIDERDLSANALARALGIPANRITAILHGQRGVTADHCTPSVPVLGDNSRILAESAEDLGAPSRRDRGGGKGNGRRSLRQETVFLAVGIETRRNGSLRR